MPIYFVRHGESHANEHNRFAGRVDTPLTELGVRQAHQAGQRVAALGIVFDEMHVSPLRRAAKTAAVIASHLDHAPPVVDAPELVERDFGVFSGHSKSLVKKKLGFHGYTEAFHRHSGTPLGGESWDEMYRRTREYYLNVLAPQEASGRNILVVTHKYIVEMFAMVIGEVAPERYHDLKVPNARPLSSAQLHALAHAPAAAEAVNDLGEVVEIRLPALAFAGAVTGVVAQLALGIAVPLPVLVTAMVALLGVNTFFGMLRIDRHILGKAADDRGAARVLLAVRAVIGLLVLLVTDNVYVLLVALYLLLPPALIAPSLSLQWGGHYFAAVRQTVGAAAVLPLVLVGVLLLPRQFAVDGLGTALTCYLIVLAGALLLPTVLAQTFRQVNPTTAGAVSTNWNWVGGLALIPLAGFAAFALTPTEPLDPDTFAAALPGVVAVAVVTTIMLVGLRLATRVLLRDSGPHTPGIARDTYIVANTPNIFLWASMAAALHPVAGWSPAPVALVVTLGFFAAILADEHYFLQRHAIRVGYADDSELPLYAVVDHLADPAVNRLALAFGIAIR